MILLGRGYSATLTGTLRASGRNYYLMVQRDATPSPLYGVPLLPHEGVRLTVERESTPDAPVDASVTTLTADNVARRADGGLDNISELHAGDRVTLQLTQAGFSNTVPGDGRFTLALVVLSESAYEVAYSWDVQVDLTAPTVSARARRLADNRTMVLVHGDDEGVTEATAELADGSYERQAWSGKRDPRTGAKAFFFTFAPEVDAATFYLVDVAGNGGSARVTFPPPGEAPAPEREPPPPEYPLPFWLREDPRE